MTLFSLQVFPHGWLHTPRTCGVFLYRDNSGSQVLEEIQLSVAESHTCTVSMSECAD